MAILPIHAHGNATLISITAMGSAYLATALPPLCQPMPTTLIGACPAVDMHAMLASFSVEEAVLNAQALAATVHKVLHPLNSALLAASVLHHQL